MFKSFFNRRLSSDSTNKVGDDESPINNGGTLYPGSRYSSNKAMIALSLEFGFMVALPLLFFAYIGKWIDGEMGTKYFLYIGIGFALFTTVFWFYRKIKSMIK